MNYLEKLSCHPLIADPLLRWSTAGTLVLAAVAFIWLAAALEGGSHLIAIHTTAAGPDFFGTKADAFAVPGIGAAIVAVNLMLTTALARRAPAAAKMFSFLTFWFAVLLLISVGSIISAN